MTASSLSKAPMKDVLRNDNKLRHNPFSLTLINSVMTEKLAPDAIFAVVGAG
jgi:hypothetical protein